MEGIGLVVLLIWLLRWRNSRAPSTNIIPPLIMISLRSFFVAIAKFVVALIAFAFAADAGYPGVALGLIAIVLFLMPTVLLEWIVVPLRMPRVAYWVARIGLPLGFIEENGAGGVVYGALAAAHTRSPLKAAAWLKRKLDEPRSLRGRGLLAAGLLAALRGDRDRARCLLLVADNLPWQVISRKARRMARDWLVAEAAQAGEWREVIRLGRRKYGSRRWSYLMARIGERLVGDKRACANWLLWLLWLAAPKRVATLPLLRRALATPRLSTGNPRQQHTTLELPQALAGLAQAFRNHQAQDGLSLSESVHAVDAALEHPATRALIEQRLAALEAQGDVDATLARARQRMINLLVPLLEMSPDLAPKDGREPIVVDAIARVRSRHFKDIEAQCHDYRERTKNKDVLDRVLEWEMWAVLRRSAERLLLLDPASEAAVFQAMWPACNNFAVLQHNDWHRLMFAYEIYSWLHKHAQSAPSALELLARNMRSASAQT
jgi:hypothetical protein